MKDNIDRASFLLGMITAFGECVAGEAKRIALSPPFYAEDKEVIEQETKRILQEQGLSLFYEENRELPAEKRLHWWVIYKYPEDLASYQEIRQKGYNPMTDFSAFETLLGYGFVWGENSHMVRPKMRQPAGQQRNPVNRILGLS